MNGQYLEESSPDLFLLATCLHAGFLRVLFFDPEDVGEIFLQNVGWLSTDYTALYPRRQKSSWTPLWEPKPLHISRWYLTIHLQILRKAIRYLSKDIW
jgi:hypothetical protein